MVLIWNPILKHVSPPTYTIYRDGDWYFARKGSSGAKAFGASDPDSVFQSCIDAKGVIYVTSNSFVFSSSFAGLDIALNTHVYMAQDALITMPNGYSGYVFNFAGNCSHSRITGGRLNEAGTPSRLWTAIRYTGHASGTYNNIVSDCRIWFANKGIEFLCADDEWANVNTIQNTEIYDSKIGVDFNFTGTYDSPAAEGMHRNYFDNVFIQCTTASVHGFKNVRHRANQFHACKVLDATGSTITMNITADATDTFIFGGLVSDLNYADLGVDTHIIEPNYNNMDLFIIGGSYSATTNSLNRRPIGFSGGAWSTTEADAQLLIPQKFKVLRVYANALTNSKNGTSTIAFRDDGSSIGELSYLTTVVGLKDSGALSTTVAGGSLCNFLVDTSASGSGTLTVMYWAICQRVS